jgi:hypothetical protein
MDRIKSLSKYVKEPVDFYRGRFASFLISMLPKAKLGSLDVRTILLGGDAARPSRLLLYRYNESGFVEVNECSHCNLILRAFLNNLVFRENLISKPEV